MKTKRNPSDELMEVLFLLAADDFKGVHGISQLSLAFIQIAANNMDLPTDSFDIKDAWYIIGYAADLAKAWGW